MLKGGMQGHDTPYQASVGDRPGATILPGACKFALPSFSSPCSLFGWLVADGWCWFVLRRVLLADCWWLVCSERKVLLAGG
jgi:hypothetical protein